MLILIVAIFCIGYLAIATEHFIKIDKAASALVMGTACWVVYAIYNSTTMSIVESQLMHHIGEISGILFFILGAMTIVELIDSHEGFDIITNSISTQSKRNLLWIIGTLAFLLSAVLDNLTTTIVMVSMCGKIIDEQKDRWKFAGLIIICANAGGAFSPIGDVTTTMLWLGNQITAKNIILKLWLPSLVCAIIPMFILSFQFGKEVLLPTKKLNTCITTVTERKIIFYSGVLLLVLVPVFKTLTHLPPFMGILLALGIMWIITATVHYKKDFASKNKFSVASALQKIDTPSILFFLGILLSVAALESIGVLKNTANFLSQHLHSETNIASALGVLSAIVDNVPLVAAAQGMYSLEQYPTDHNFWELIALTTGTGGSMIIIGSAAGVAAMGIENIPFGWYLKKISWIAAIGFIAGILCFVMMNG
jgi:Na+/H+ antiporter NhaD/arsenite permease-like protein